ncbi:MAG: glycosyltransferase [Spirosomataceae bacterium]
MNNAAIFRFFFSIFDRLARRYFYLIFAEKSYLATYHDLAKPHEVILNYPNLEFFEPFYQARIGKTPQRTIFYIGQLSMARGIDTLIKAVALLRPEYPDLQVHLVGGFEFDIRSKQDLYQIENYEETKENLVFHGKMDARLGLRFATEAAVGVALLKSVGDFPESYPTKIFEYMALGMPVITSDFPLYRPIVQGNQAGFCIDPTNAVALAQAFRWIMEHPEQAQAMGQRGREAVKKYYNWQSEEAKLFRLYEQILGT